MKQPTFPYISGIDSNIRKRIKQIMIADVPDLKHWYRVTSGMYNKNGHKHYQLAPLLNDDIAKNTPTSFASQYDALQGFAPIPALLKVTSKYIGKYGGLREVKLDWICYTKLQFDEYMTPFATPGHMLYVDWGDGPESLSVNPRNVVKEALSNPIDFQSKFSTVWETIKKYSTTYNQKYDGCLAIVTKFEWSLQSDMSYLISVTTKTIGSLMSGISVSNQKTSDVPKEVTGIRDFFKSINGDREKGLESFCNDNYKNNDNINGTNFKFGTPSTSTTPGGGNVQSKTTTTQNTDLWIWAGNDIFISEFLLELIVNRYTAEYRGVLYLNSTTSKLRNSKYLLSSDLSKVLIPNICITKELETSDSRVTNYSYVREFTKDPLENNPDLKKSLLGELGENAGDNSYSATDSDNDRLKAINKDMADYVAKNNIATAGYVSNFYINMNLVVNAFDNKDSINDAMTDILNNINSCSGNMWNLVYVSDEGTSTAHIIDSNFFDVENFNNTISNLYFFDPYNPKSIIREISLRGDINDSIALTNFYGALDGSVTVNSQFSPAFKSLWNNEEYVDEFMKQIKIDKPKDASVKQQDTNDKSCLINTSENSSIEIGLKLAFLPRMLLENGSISLIPEKQLKLIAGCEVSGMRRIINFYQGGEAGNNSFLTPIEIDVKLEGISGFQIGNIFSTTVLPNTYIKRGYFQVTGIDDDVDENGWETTLKGRYRIVGDKFTIPPPPKVNNTYSSSTTSDSSNDKIGALQNITQADIDVSHVDELKKALLKNNKETAFVKTYYKYAKDLQSNYNIPIASILAIAAYESAWGDSSLMKKYNNIGGMRASNNTTKGKVWFAATRHKNTRDNAPASEYNASWWQVNKNIKDAFSTVYSTLNSRFKDNPLGLGNDKIELAKKDPVYFLDNFIFPDPDSPKLNKSKPLYAKISRKLNGKTFTTTPYSDVAKSISKIMKDNGLSA
jgi:flagellum-specific peptidoglycan hydrolase FlgJ